MKERHIIDGRYEIEIKITLPLNSKRPIYEAEISMALIDKQGENSLHISNHHYHSSDPLGRKLNGYPNIKTKTGREIFVNLSEGENPKKMSFESLKNNFINECCKKIGEEKRNILETLLRKYSEEQLKGQN